MAQEQITREAIVKAKAMLKRHRVIPNVVRSKAEARRFTIADRRMFKTLGLKHTPRPWKVGDEYFVACFAFDSAAPIHARGSV